MHRVMWLKIGGQRFHLLKLAGAFFVMAAVLKVAEAAYWIFVTVDKINYAMMRPEMITQLFGWAMAAPHAFSGEDTLGVLLGPIGAFLFWLGVAVLALMIYQAGRVIVPVEEYEQRVSDYHQHLIRRAVAAHKKK